MIRVNSVHITSQRVSDSAIRVNSVQRLFFLSIKHNSMVKNQSRPSHAHCVHSHEGSRWRKQRNSLYFRYCHHALHDSLQYWFHSTWTYLEFFQGYQGLSLTTDCMPPISRLQDDLWMSCYWISMLLGGKFIKEYFLVIWLLFIIFIGTIRRTAVIFEGLEDKPWLAPRPFAPCQNHKTNTS